MPSGKTLFKIGAVLAPIIAAIIALMPGILKQDPPRFILAQTIVKIDKPIIIKAANKAADRDELLNVEFDKHLLENAGKPFTNEDDDTQRWRFNINKHNPTASMLKLDEHTLRFGFAGEGLSEEQKVTFIAADKVPPAEKKKKKSFSSLVITVFIFLFIVLIVVVIIVAMKNE